MSLRELIVGYDAVLINAWDHTAVITCQIYNLMTVTGAAFGAKSRAGPRSPAHFNPYRKPERKRNAVSDINDLKIFCRGR